MLNLILAAIVFDAMHLGVAVLGLREGLVQRLGRMGYMIAFSLASLLTLAWLVVAYKRAPYLPTWGMLQWWKPAALVLMAAVFVLAAAGLIHRRPASTADAGDPLSPRGIHRITRHPLLAAVSLWAAVHLIGNGDYASLVFFAAFAAMSVGGIWSMDRRRRTALGEAEWRSVAMTTSVVPFAAIARGQNRFEFSEIGFPPLAVGLAAFAVVLAAHSSIIGVSPFP